jgi:hypothetical protein
MPSLIEAHPLGWWYSAGLPSGSAIAIFFTDSDICSKLELRKTFRHVLGETQHTLQRFESAQLTGDPRVFPAGSHCLDRASGDSWLAIGDAATGRDPLSSSGIDFALASAQRACEVLCSIANGMKEDLKTYDAQVRCDFEAYLAQRDAYYQMENRWPNSPFWRRRQSDLIPPELAPNRHNLKNSLGPAHSFPAAWRSPCPFDNDVLSAAVRPLSSCFVRIHSKPYQSSQNRSIYIYIVLSHQSRAPTVSLQFA